jgi:hypothetical protein
MESSPGLAKGKVSVPSAAARLGERGGRTGAEGAKWADWAGSTTMGCSKYGMQGLLLGESMSERVDEAPLVIVRERALVLGRLLRLVRLELLSTERNSFFHGSPLSATATNDVAIIQAVAPVPGGSQ